MLKFKSEKIKDVVLAVTYQCNSRCQFCDIWKKTETYSLRPLDYLNLPRSLKSVNLSGGEPFLRKDLVEIIKSVKQAAPKAALIISTNGFCPKIVAQKIAQIKQLEPNIGVAISLDGTKSVHEELRGVVGGFELVMETLRILKENQVKKIKLAFTLGDQNFQELAKVYKIAQEEKVELTLAVQHNSDHYFSKETNQITDLKSIDQSLNWLIDQELKTFSPKRWLRAYFTFGAIYFLKNQKRLLPDYSGLSSLFIDPHGQIYPSDVWNFKLGQLQEVTDWSAFSQVTALKLSQQKGPANWMICTARQAIKKHPFSFLSWLIQKKI